MYSLSQYFFDSVDDLVCFCSSDSFHFFSRVSGIRWLSDLTRSFFDFGMERFKDCLATLLLNSTLLLNLFVVLDLVLSLNFCDAISCPLFVFCPVLKFETNFLTLLLRLQQCFCNDDDPRCFLRSHLKVGCSFSKQFLKLISFRLSDNYSLRRFVLPLNCLCSSAW